MVREMPELRWVAAIVAVIVMGGLIYSGAVEAQAGLLVIVGVLGGVGVYERRKRVKLEDKLR